MKLTANEEYGLRCLVRIGYAGEGGSLTIPEISQAEGVSPAYAAKILRVLRKGGFVKAARGKDGGYTLARPAEAIVIGDVMDVLGGRIFESRFLRQPRRPGGHLHALAWIAPCAPSGAPSRWRWTRCSARPPARSAAERRRNELLGPDHPRRQGPAVLIQ